MDLIECKKAYNGLLSMIYVVTYSLRKFRKLSEESCSICRQLERAVENAEEFVLWDDIAPYEAYEKAFDSLATSLAPIMEYALKHKTVEGIEDVYSCLSLIGNVCGVATSSPESNREARVGMEKVVDSILQPLRREKSSKVNSSQKESGWVLVPKEKNGGSKYELAYPYNLLDFLFNSTPYKWPEDIAETTDFVLRELSEREQQFVRYRFLERRSIEEIVPLLKYKSTSSVYNFQLRIKLKLRSQKRFTYFKNGLAKQRQIEADFKTEYENGFKVSNA